MAIEWAGLGLMVGAESVLLFFLIVPWPQKFRGSVISVSRSVLQPLMAVLPFAAFLMLDIYLKYESRMQCKSNSCTQMDREHYAKSVMKSQRNAILAFFAVFLYWVLYRVTHLLVDLERLHKRSSPSSD